MKSEDPKFIVVIGTSAGGLNTIVELTEGISTDTNAAFFVVTHLPSRQENHYFMDRVQRNTSLICKWAEDGESIKTSYLYFAAPGRHLIIKEGIIVLSDGATENGWRPSIDVLFRTAAAAYNSRVIGIILTGLLSDGTAGMIAVKKCGGTSIIQDPEEAAYSNMPLSVLQNVDVDFSLPVHQISTLLREKTIDGVPPTFPVPSEIKAEVNIIENSAVDMNAVAEIGKHTVFTCPDCGGGLWEIKENGLSRFRCHTGHVYSEQDFDKKQKESMEATLWVALRMLEERKQLLDRMIRQDISRGWVSLSKRKQERVAELKTHIERLKQLLFDTKQ